MYLPGAPFPLPPGAGDTVTLGGSGGASAYERQSWLRLRIAALVAHIMARIHISDVVDVAGLLVAVQVGAPCGDRPPVVVMSPRAPGGPPTSRSQRPCHPQTRLPALMTRVPVRLVIVDSIASVFRAEALEVSALRCRRIVCACPRSGSR